MHFQREVNLFSLSKNNMPAERQPKNTFPNELIKKCQRLIFERSGKRITKDKAEIYLEKLGRFFLLAVKVLDQEEKEQKERNKSKTKTKPKLKPAPIKP